MSKLKDFLQIIACILVPHIMLVIGLYYVAKSDEDQKKFGKKICLFSSAVIIIGSFVYYIYYTPVIKIDI